jgi:hypothetical protein
MGDLRLTITLQGVPASPLRSVSRDLFDSESEYDGPATAAGRREQSEGDMGLETGDCVLERRRRCESREETTQPRVVEQERSEAVRGRGKGA